MTFVNNVVNRMSAWAQYLTSDPADEDAALLARDVLKLLDVIRTSNELLLRVEEVTDVTDRAAPDKYRDVRLPLTATLPLIAALKAVAEHQVHIHKPESKVELILPPGVR